MQKEKKLRKITRHELLRNSVENRRTDAAHKTGKFNNILNNEHNGE